MAKTTKHPAEATPPPMEAPPEAPGVGPDIRAAFDAYAQPRIARAVADLTRAHTAALAERDAELAGLREALASARAELARVALLPALPEVAITRPVLAERIGILHAMTESFIEAARIRMSELRTALKRTA